MFGLDLPIIGVIIAAILGAFVYVYTTGKSAAKNAAAAENARKNAETDAAIVKARDVVARDNDPNRSLHDNWTRD